MFKKLLISLLLGIVLLAPFTAVAHAQTTWYNQGFSEWYLKVYDNNNQSEIFGERYTAAQIQWIYYSIISFVINMMTGGNTQLVSCVMSPDVGTCIEGALEAIPFVGSSSPNGTENFSVVSVFSNRPISGVGYLLNIGKNLNIIPEVQAQGFGFQAASPVLTLWRVTRNMTYGLLILVVIAMAFMIMFRVKISPQTVISVQSALPRVVLAIILITFSYAIAGFLIDLMYVVIGLVAALFAGSGLLSAPFNQFGTMFGALTTERNVLTLILNYFISFLIIYMPASITGWESLLIAPLAAAIFPLVLIVLTVVLIFVFFRIFWLLLRTYVTILLLIIVGPLQILIGAVSATGGFGLWLRNLAANLAVYPIVGVMFVVAFVFLGAALDENISSGLTPDWVRNAILPFNVASGALGGNTWAPPLTLGESLHGLLWLGASFVIITLIPRTADIIRSFIQGQEFGFGTAIGQQFAQVGTGVAMGTRIGQAVINRGRAGLAGGGAAPNNAAVPQPAAQAGAAGGGGVPGGTTTI